MDKLFGKPIILFYATGWCNSFFNFYQVDAVFLDLAFLDLAFLVLAFLDLAFLVLAFLVLAFL